MLKNTTSFNFNELHINMFYKIVVTLCNYDKVYLLIIKQIRRLFTFTFMFVTIVIKPIIA